MKKIFIFIFFILLMPLFVHAGTIEFTNPTQTSANTYEFVLKVENITLNRIEGDFHITNGTITSIEMSSLWKNKTGLDNHFYFYRDGAINGSYTVAKVEVTMTDNSVYSVHNLEYTFNQCTVDQYGNYFGENGNLVSKNTYDATCGVSKDATLKSITPSHGKLSPKFDPFLTIYGITVENSVDSIQFNPIPTDNKAKVVSGERCSLKVGVTQCKIVVEAPSGNQKTYTISVARKNTSNNILSSDTSISNLKVHGGTLTKPFDTKIKKYDLKISKETKSIYFTFLTNSDKVQHKSDSCNVTEGTKTCTLTIIAEDGVTKDDFVFTIVRDKKETENNSTTGNKNSPNIDKNNSSNMEEKNEILNENDHSDSSSDIKIETTPNDVSEESQNPNKEIIEKSSDKSKKNNIFLGILLVLDFLIGLGTGYMLIQKINLKKVKDRSKKKKKAKKRNS